MAALISHSTTVDLSAKLRVIRVGYLPIKPPSAFDIPLSCRLSLDGSKWSKGYLKMETYSPSFGSFEDESNEEVTQLGFLVSINGTFAARIITMRFENGTTARLQVLTNLVFFDIFEKGKRFIRFWENITKTPIRIVAERVYVDRTEMPKTARSPPPNPGADVKSERKRKNTEIVELGPVIKEPRVAPDAVKRKCKAIMRRRKLPIAK